MSSELAIILLLQVLVGVLGMPVMDWIKKKLGLEGTAALFLVAALSTVAGIGALFVSGEVGLMEFTWVNLPHVFTVVFTAATIAYRLIYPEPQT